MGKLGKYTQGYHGVPFDLERVGNKAALRFMCCDCGSVHDLDFTVHPNKLVITPSAVERATAAARRQNYFKCVRR